MSLLRSYSFGVFHGVNELPEEVLNLFSGVDATKEIEFAGEIISAGLQGNIRFDQTFNIDAYQAAIRKNQRLNLEHSRKKQVFLDFSDNSDDWESTAMSGGIKADVATVKAVNQMEDAYEQLILGEDLKYAIETIKSLQPTLLVDAQIDFLHTMKQALRGIPESVSLLKKVCEEYEVLAEQVHTVLSAGLSFEEMFE